DAPGERRMREKLDAFGPRDRVVRHELAGVDDEMPARLEALTVVLEPLLELAGPRENADAVTVAQPVASLLSNNAGRVVASFFEHRGSRYPQRLDLDASLTLILLRVIEPEEFVRAAAMIVIKMGEAYRVVKVPLDRAQIRLEFGRQVDPRIPR